MNMLGKAPPTTSSLNLVNSDIPDYTVALDVNDGVQMADLVESLDTRELDIGEGEDIEYDGSTLGMIIDFRCQVNADENIVTWGVSGSGVDP